MEETKNKVLRMRLAELDMSFSQLAREAGTHPSVISNAYTGKKKLPKELADKVGKILGRTPKKLGLL